MAEITVATVEHVARLARLELAPEEKERIARELGDVLRYAESIQALDVADVPPMAHAPAGAPLREDAVVPGLPREQALESAPDVADALYRVPRVIA